MLRRGKRYLVKDDEINVKHDYVRFFTAENPPSLKLRRAKKEKKEITQSECIK